MHNTEEVIERFGYEPERDTRNPVDSVFCAGGSGYVVPWNEVREHAHVEIAVTDSGVAGGQSDREVKLTAKQASRTVSDEWIGNREVDRILNETYFSNSRGDNEEEVIERKLTQQLEDMLQAVMPMLKTLLKHLNIIQIRRVFFLLTDII